MIKITTQVSDIIFSAMHRGEDCDGLELHAAGLAIASAVPIDDVDAYHRIHYRYVAAERADYECMRACVLASGFQAWPLPPAGTPELLRVQAA